MPRGQEAAAGGEEVISEAEPDAAELCFGKIPGHQILNHSLCPLSFSLLYDSLIIYFISLPLTLSHSHPCISVSIPSRENEICDKGETHSSVMSSQEVEEMYPLPCSLLVN